MKIHYNFNFKDDSTIRADSSLESAPALFFNGIGGSDSGFKMESQHLFPENFSITATIILPYRIESKQLVDNRFFGLGWFLFAGAKKNCDS